MKKVVALLLGSALLATTVAGLAACKEKTPETPKPAEGFKRLVDPRDAAAFEAHAKDGTLVGTYPSIALAINAAVENDLDDFEAVDVSPTARGSYVTKKGSTRKIFENMVKFSEDSAQDNYWYYSNNSLTGFEPWTTGVPYSRAQNGKEIVYKINQGTSAVVADSNWGLYDGLGQLVDTMKQDIASRAWELVAGADASIRGVPVREAGATGARYTLDLSDVQIKPAYEGVEDDVYAFFGFVIGSGTYSLEIGLACDVNTGAWKQYLSHDPHNNNYAVCNEYNIGETVFTSTWNEEGGYYSPDLDTVTLEIKEVKDEDELGEDWWYNKVEITAGEKTITVIADDEYMSGIGLVGANFDTKNGFYFTAGLDIVAPGAQIGDDIKAPDYTIGATFENLIVESGEIYFPDYDEISDEDYGAIINPELRGGYHSIRAPFESITRGIYNYTILNVNACVDYEIVDGLDMYSFRYDNYEVPSSDFMGELKTYQDKIDTLLAITAENAGEFKATLDQVGEWRGPDGVAETGKIPAYCYYVIDWTPYLDALEIYKNAVELSEEGEALYADFQKLTAIDSIAAWKGWKSNGDGDTGYIYNELQIFKGLAERYETLPETDYAGFEQLVGDKWGAWMELYEDIIAIEASEFATKSFSINNYAETGYETMTGLQLVDEFFVMAFRAYDHRSLTHTDCGGALCVEISGGEQDHFLTTFRLFYLDWLFEQEGVTLGYRYDLIDMLKDYCNGSGASSYRDFQYIAAVSVQLQRIITGECTYLDEELADMINTHMYGFGQFNNGTWHYAYTVGGGDLQAPMKGWKRYFGEELQNTGKTFSALIHGELLTIIERDSDATILPIFYQNADRKGLAVDKKVEAIKLELSKEGEAWYETWKALPAVDGLAGWKGWKSEDASATGYIYNTLAEAKALIAEHDQLSAIDQEMLSMFVDETIATWKQLETDYAALQNNNTTVSVWDKNFTGTTEMKLVEVFEAFVNAAVFHNVGGCNEQQGYLCMEHIDCGLNSMYTLYLNKVLEAAEAPIAYWQTLVSLLKNQGESNSQYTGRFAGEGAFIDFDYIWNIGKQVGRIVRKECTYLDEELAEAVNKYMVANDSKSSSGYGTLNCFYNGTWAYAYYAGTPGYIKGYGANWMKAIDEDLAQVTGGSNWGAAIQYVTNILTKAGYGNLLVAANSKPTNTVPPMVISDKVEAQDDPNLGDVEATVEGVVEAFNKLALGDLTNPRYWVGGKSTDGDSKGFIYDEVLMFRTVYTVYLKLSAEDRAAVNAQASTFEKWISLSEQYAKVEANANKYTIINGNNLQVLGTTVDVNALAIVNAFFNFGFSHYDEGLSHTTTGNKYGFLCMEHEEHFLQTMRALYLHKLIVELDLGFPFADEMLTAMADYEGNGNSKYTGFTETWGAIKDFDYLWAMAAQIKRIRENNVNELDAELVAAINAYMVQGPDMESGKLHTAGSFYNLSPSNCFRNFGGTIGVVDKTVTGWEAYLGLPMGDGNWGTLIEEVNKIIRKYYGEEVLVKTTNATNAYTMLVSRELEEHYDDLSDLDPAVAEIVNGFEGLNDLHTLTAWYGWTGTEKGYVAYELGLFGELFTKYNALSAENQEAVLAKVDSAAWTTWTTLNTAYAALLANETKVSVWDKTFSAESETAIADAFTAFVDGVFWAKRVGRVDAAQGYLCVENEDQNQNTMYVLYLNKVLGENNVEIGASFFKLVENEGSGIVQDFDYIWYMSAQAARIIKGDCTYLDAELAEAINKYMYVDPAPAANCFRNGTWSWAYRANWFKGGTKKFASSYWIRALDPVLFDMMEKNAEGAVSNDNFYWYPVINKITDILKNVGYGSYLLNVDVTGGNGQYYKANCVPMYISCEVEVRTEAPKVGDVETSVNGVATAFKMLSDLNTVTEWKGWEGTENGYLQFELEAFGKVLAAYNELSAEDQAAVLAEVGEEKWNGWATLNSEYNALVEDGTKLSVWDTAYGQQSEMTLAEIFEKFVDGLFWPKRMNKIDPVQGYFDQENDVTAVNNGIYTLYLNNLLIENVENLAFRATAINMVRAEGADFVADYEYIWNVGKQIARIMDGLNYIDEELAEVVNTYMVSASKSNFNNGTWAYFYKSGGGIAPKVDPYWIKAIDPKLNTSSIATTDYYKVHWSVAMAYLTGPNGLLTKAGYSAYYKAVGGNFNALFLTTEVEVQEAPEQLVATVESVVKTFNAEKFGDLTNANPTYWKGGKSASGDTKGYFYDEAMMFGNIYKVYLTLSEEDQAAVKAQVEVFAKWESLYKDYVALEAAQEKYDIVNGNATEVYANTVNVNGFAIVNGFFNALAASYDDVNDAASMSGGGKFGYLSMEKKEYFLMSMRALYLHNLIATTETINFPFATEFLTTAAAYGNGETVKEKLYSKYTGYQYTEAQSSILDFEYFMTMTAQIKRIMAMETKLTAMDDELKGVVDNYIKTRMIKGMRADKADPNTYAVSNCFYSLDLAVQYRDKGEVGFGTDWERYLGLDASKTWSQLLAEYINPAVAGSGYQLIAPSSGTSAPTMYAKPEND